MRILERLHQKWVYGKRIDSLRRALERRLPNGARVLDIGCGDGRLAYEIVQLRPDLTIEGVDVLLRPNACIPVRAFDGVTLPFPDGHFDVAMFVDVLHHADEPLRLLREASRVAPVLVIKDHLREGFLAQPTLRLMDWMGNARHGVNLIYRYWNRAEWSATFATLGLDVDELDDDVDLYGPPFQWLFGRSLHFVARLSKK